MKIYFLQNAEGKFFKSRGQSGYGPRWVDEMEKAKPYLKRGQAVAQITRWYNMYPEYGAPSLVTCGVAVESREDLTESSKNKRNKQVKVLVDEINAAHKELAFMEYGVGSSSAAVNGARKSSRESLRRSISTNEYLLKRKFADIDWKSMLSSPLH